VERGASLVMNDVDSLTPGLAGVSEALEGAGLGKAQANVYVSFQSHKAFPAHYDTHDVWAVQVEGEKTWNIWEGRADYPLPHPIFRNLGQAHHEQAKGKLRERVVLRAGDLLYLPRGWYHDALAEEATSVHISYGVHAPLGMDLVNILLERALYDGEFRKPLPRQDGSAAARFALTTRAGQLGGRLAELCRDPKVMEVLAGFVADYRFRRGGNDLLAARGLSAPAAAPAAGDDAEAPALRVLQPGAKPVRRGGDWVIKTAGGALPLSAGRPRRRAGSCRAPTWPSRSCAPRTPAWTRPLSSGACEKRGCWPPHDEGRRRALLLLPGAAAAQVRPFNCVGAEQLEGDVFAIPFARRAATPGESARGNLEAAAELAKREPERNLCVLGHAGPQEAAPPPARAWRRSARARWRTPWPASAWSATACAPKPTAPPSPAAGRSPPSAA
jgi:hypothetical protein